MKLYYCPFACSLADHIALEEAGIDFERERVDLKLKVTASGQNYIKLTSKGYVPALQLDNGEIITENVAILDWIASHYPKLGIRGELGRTRLLEALAYISTELHRSLRPLWHSGSDQEMAEARAAIETRLEFLSNSLAGDYLFGEHPTVADCYLFVMLLWAERFGLEVPKPLVGLRERMRTRPAVKVALAIEGLS
ncbi:glutathione S-transferase [Rhizobium sp. BK650]|uniref:glutathione S-transferase C-terminal domain-containing protein n=1 Tax=Rhizobium sp. BK650 TaxID=2586990 RepID=UPI001617F575|nr:glutathione binding-like protein [Rhizobium sp. BK650]MBB3659424.1 glutathione S-transferase [Rhizobium sp. BK650]